MLTLALDPPLITRVAIAPAAEAIVSWNTASPRLALALVVELVDGRRSGWLPYVAVTPERRRSLSGADAIARIDVDIVRAIAPIAAIEVHADAPLTLVAVATPVPHLATTIAPPAIDLAVDARSQYLATHPTQRGWCSPASLAMVLAHAGRSVETIDVVRGIDDEAYGGTGNWVFAAAFAGGAGMHAFVAYLAGLAQAARLIAAGVPLVLSLAWKDGALPGRLFRRPPAIWSSYADSMDVEIPSSTIPPAPRCAPPAIARRSNARGWVIAASRTSSFRASGSPRRSRSSMDERSVAQPRERVTAARADAPLHVVLVEPQIPPNTGNVARLCAATGCALHLVAPLGFSIDDRALKRAGLDYWHALDLTIHASLDEMLATFAGRLWLVSTRGAQAYADVAYARGDALVFGKETAGLPQALLDAHLERTVSIPMRFDAVRSLNLSTAVGIVTYAAFAKLGFPGAISPRR